MRLASPITEAEARRIEQIAAILPSSTIRRVRVVPNLDTWAVSCDEKRRPRELLVGQQSDKFIEPSMHDAVASHEAAHSAVTFYSPKHEDCPKELAHELGNILEDTRMNRQLQHKFPGLVPAFDKLFGKVLDLSKLEVVDGNRVLRNWQDVCSALVCLTTRRDSDFAEQGFTVAGPQDIRLLGGNTRTLNLHRMWQDAKLLVEDVCACDCDFSKPESYRRASNLVSVQRINEFLDRYSWVFRNEKDKAAALAKALQKLQSERGMDAQKRDASGREPVEMGEETDSLPERDAGQREQRDRQRMNEIIEDTAPNRQGGGKSDDSLAAWYNPELAKCMVAEINQHFPISVSRGGSRSYIREERRYYASDDGAINPDALPDYMARQRPAGSRIFTSSRVKKVQSPSLALPLKGQEFPIKRMALFLDTSGSMTGQVGAMVAFCQAYGLFAKKHQVEMRFVVGTTGVHVVKPGDYAALAQLLEMPRGDCGNQPTWNPEDVEATLAWLGSDGKGVFVTDLAIQEDEQELVRQQVEAGRAIQLNKIDVEKLAALLWGRARGMTEMPQAVPKASSTAQSNLPELA